MAIQRICTLGLIARGDARSESVALKLDFFVNDLRVNVTGT
jgi:hypothetical protein